VFPSTIRPHEHPQTECSENPIDHPENEHFADGFYKFPKIRKDLGLDGGDNE
jgi:hypothetical protein